jgi:hypothetical protein
VAPLVAWETSKGRTVEVVTMSWIDATYWGWDPAHSIREFLREKYPSAEWGIEDVLLVGHYDDVPMRRTAQDLSYGRPETDFYYAELSLPDDQSWDVDGDHQWGEYLDPIDFYAEVNVGRIPWSDPATVLSICEKSVAYEQNDDPAFKKNILLLGAFFWNNDPNPRTDNAVLMEAKVDQPWMADWTMTRGRLDDDPDVRAERAVLLGVSVRLPASSPERDGRLARREIRVRQLGRPRFADLDAHLRPRRALLHQGIRLLVAQRRLSGHHLRRCVQQLRYGPPQYRAGHAPTGRRRLPGGDEGRVRAPGVE